MGAVLVDGAGGPPVSNSILMISGSRIAAAGPRTAFVIPQNTEEIDGSGKFVVPAPIGVYMRTGNSVTATAGGETLSAGVITANTTPADAHRQMGEFGAAHRYIAVLDDVPRATEEAALEAGRRNQLPVFAQVSKLADAQRLVAAGAAGFVGMITDTGNIDRAFVAKMRDLRVVWIPNLSHQPAASLEMAKRNTMQLASAGVPIAVCCLDGREMELLVETGMSPGDVIVAATRIGASVVRKTADLGTLTPGKFADLWMLPKNPLEDVRNLHGPGIRKMRRGEWP